MSIYKKASTSDDIINGLAVVLDGSGKCQTYDNTDRTRHFASGDSLSTFVVLEGRYKVDPSGWSR